MRFDEKLYNIRDRNNSLLCIGLDTDINLLPKSLLKKTNPIYTFNKQIIDVTYDLVCAYKLNSAFYEAYGWNDLKKTRDYIPSDIPVIVDAKRGDIGNTSKTYAYTFLEKFGFDAITLNPYMGFDSIKPFLDYKDKFVFILCLSSNPGAKDFQLYGEKPLYEQVTKTVNQWNKSGNCGLIVGATKPNELKNIRQIVPELLLLIPGIGAQGGNIGTVLTYGGENIIINSSRSIIYASSGTNFAQKSREAAIKLRDEINKYRTAD